MLKSLVQGLMSGYGLLFFFLGITSQANSKNCGLALTEYRGSLVPRKETQLRAFLVDVLRKYREGFTGPNENLKHTRRMVKIIRDNAEELRRQGLDPSLLEIGIFLSDVAKNPVLVEKYKKDYGDNAYVTFIDHARLGLVEGYLLKENYPITDAQWEIIVEVIIGHDGPSTPGSWWTSNFSPLVGYQYPPLTPHSKYAYIHALLDRMDQGGVYRDHKNIYQGGVRKISFDQLRSRLKTPHPFVLRQTIEYALNNIYPGSRLQVNDLLNQQANFFPDGIPLFLIPLIKEFESSFHLKDKVEFVEAEIHFINKNGSTLVISPLNDGNYKVSSSDKVMSAEETLLYFWEQL